ncbi:MAG: IS21 family transposase [Chloroflexota bacterium]|nr:IS21 family transposase [Chloroflexota bacterium]
MAYKEVSRVDVMEVIRRWQQGDSQRHIAAGTGLSRDTIRKYLAAAVESGVQREGPNPTEEQLSRLVALSRSGPRQTVAPAEELLESWGDQIYRWVTVDRLQVTRIQELLAQRGCAVSYTSLRRFLQRRNWRRRSLRTVRMEQSPPGEVAEMDFGRLGYIQDEEIGRRCTVWALLVVLTYSRHCFLWPAYGQKLEDVIAGLEAAWSFFGGIPKYLVIDNFPAAVAGADALHPRLTRGFLEYSQHRGFITDPARVRRPKDKPMVERSVQYARERFFKGGDFKDLFDVRNQAQRWCRDVAGLRIHGTTRRQPLQVFLDEERQALLPWDGVPYEVTHWRTAKVHTDHHVACQYALYSVPSTLCPPGQQVEVGLGTKLVRIFHRGQLVKVHPRQPKGGRSTDTADYPAELSAYTLRAPDAIKRKAAEQGPAVAEFAERLFDGPLPWSRIRQGHKLIRLGESYTPQRLDAACRRALDVDLIDVGRVERILVQALEQQETPDYPPALPAGRFARPGDVFAHGKAHTHQSTGSTESAQLKTGGQS